MVGTRVEGQPDQEGPQLGGPGFVVVISGDRAFAESSVHQLVPNLEEVHFGRSETPGWSRGAKQLELGFADEWMSSAHAKIIADRGRHILVDCQSTNGSYVGGVQVTSHRLSDGDVVMLGRTVLLYREALAELPVPDLAAEALPEPLPGLRSFSPGLTRTYDDARKLAGSELSLFIAGESGVGKDRLAQAIHAASGRTGRFVAINCGAIAPQLIESELFGHRKGAFSGATRDHVGLIRSAEGGTLFLDEIAELPSEAQTKFLRVLESHRVVAVGSAQEVPVNFRVIAATHGSLSAMVTAGEFRADLLARIAGCRLQLPPLRDRLEDFGLLVADILRRRPAAVDVRFSREALRAAMTHDWPLNIRELVNWLEAGLALGEDGEITRGPTAPAGRAANREDGPGNPHDVSESAQPPSKRLGRGDDVELRRQLLAHLRAEAGNISAVARALGTSRTQVHRWIRRFGFDLAALRDDGSQD